MIHAIDTEQALIAQLAAIQKESAEIQANKATGIDWQHTNLSTGEATLTFRIGANCLVEIRQATQPRKQVLLRIDPTVLEQFGKDPEDQNLSLLMALLELARNRIQASAAKHANWRLVNMPTAAIVERCKLLAERYLDDSLRLLQIGTVLNYDGTFARMAIYQPVANSVLTLCLEINFVSQSVRKDSVQIYENQHELLGFLQKESTSFKSKRAQEAF